MHPVNFMNRTDNVPLLRIHVSTPLLAIVAMIALLSAPFAPLFSQDNCYYDGTCTGGTSPNGETKNIAKIQRKDDAEPYFQPILSTAEIPIPISINSCVTEGVERTALGSKAPKDKGGHVMSSFKCGILRAYNVNHWVRKGEPKNTGKTTETETVERDIEYELGSSLAGGIVSSKTRAGNKWIHEVKYEAFRWECAYEAIINEALYEDKGDCGKENSLIKDVPPCPEP